MLETLLLSSGWAVALLVGVHGRLVLGRRMEAVARACHELRSPLAAARLGVSVPGGGAGPMATRLRVVELELGRATLALEDLARARAGTTASASFEELELGALVLDCVASWSASADRTGLSLEARWEAGPVYVRGHRIRLAQLLGNLIGNALEHGRGPVSVVGRYDRGRVRVEVQDGGPGLPAPVADLARRASRGRGERGRGLAISQEIALAHGGRLAAAPCERGARLVLELPAAGAGDACEVPGE